MNTYRPADTQTSLTTQTVRSTPPAWPPPASRSQVPRPSAGLRLQSAQTTARNGRIKQSIAYWCFNVAGDKWDIQQQAQVATATGLRQRRTGGTDRFHRTERATA